MRLFALLAALFLIPYFATAQDPSAQTSDPPVESTSDLIAPEVDSDGDLIPDYRDPRPLVANVPVYWSVQQFVLSRQTIGDSGDGRSQNGHTWSASPSLVIAQVTTNPPAPKVPSGFTVMPLTSRKPKAQLNGHPFAPLAVFGADAIRIGILERARAAAFLHGWRKDGANTPIQLAFTVRFLNLDTRKWEMLNLEVPVILGGKIWAVARVMPKKPGDNGLCLLVGDKVVKQDFVAEIDASSAGAFLSLLSSSDFTPAFDFAGVAAPEDSPQPGDYSLSSAFQSILLKTRQIRIEGPDGLVWNWRVATNDRRTGSPVTCGQLAEDMNAVSEQVYGKPIFAFDGTYPISIAGWDNGFWDLYWKVSRKGRDLDPSELLSSRFNADIVLSLSATPPSSLPAGGSTPIISHLRGVLFYHADRDDLAVENFTIAANEGAPQGYSWCGRCKARTPVKQDEDASPSGAGRPEFGQNLAEAAHLYKLAADAGYAPGLAWYGRALADGEGVTANKQAALAELKKAADQGFAEGCFLYGFFLMNGIGVKANRAEAMKFLEKAAWQGCLPAIAAYGEGLLDSGSPEGRDWIELAAKNGDGKAAARFARFLREGELGTVPDPAYAAKWLQRAADDGDAPSLVALGEALRAGAGVRRNPKKAAEYFRRAADAGNIEGRTWYALCLLEGNGVRRDVPRALDLLSQAADAGNAKAMFLHGVCLFGGYGGTAPDKPAAMVRFKSAAAEQPAANVFLGVGYLNGLGLKKDEKKAVECFKAAADRDLPAGILWLAHCYANGVGVKKDLEEARNWARKAANLGIPAGRQMLLSIQE